MLKTIVGALGALSIVAMLAGCGGVADTGHTDTFDIVVTGGKSNLGDISARQGDTIKMTVSCDKEEEIHLHGFDYKFNCTPAAPAAKTFKADRTGQFEYEIEATSTQLGNLTIRP